MIQFGMLELQHRRENTPERSRTNPANSVANRSGLYWPDLLFDIGILHQRTISQRPSLHVIS